MSVTTLGCAGSFFDPDRGQPCSGYLVESEGAALVVDCGYGTFASYRSLARAEGVRAIVISHAHRDHFADLADFLLRFSSSRREAPLVVGSSETLCALSEALGELETEVVSVDSKSQVTLGPFEVTFSVTTHQLPTLASRVRVGNTSLVYSADTGPGWHVPGDWRGAGVALVECTYLATAPPRSYHLGVGDAMALARELNAATTLLTHVPPGEDAQQRLDLARQREPTLKFDLAERARRVVVPASSQN